MLCASRGIRTPCRLSTPFRGGSTISCSPCDRGKLWAEGLGQRVSAGSRGSGVPVASCLPRQGGAKPLGVRVQIGHSQGVSAVSGSTAQWRDGRLGVSAQKIVCQAWAGGCRFRRARVCRVSKLSGCQVEVAQESPHAEGVFRVTGHVLGDVCRVASAWDGDGAQPMTSGAGSVAHRPGSRVDPRRESIKGWRLAFRRLTRGSARDGLRACFPSHTANASSVLEPVLVAGWPPVALLLSVALLATGPPSERTRARPWAGHRRRCPP